MSNSFNDQLSRMKALMTYGAVNEDAKPISTYNIEYKAKAADGKYYGIIRENSKYFVKVATPGKETIAEAYQYIGGINNKANYEYNSYSNALKQFELKLGSINEAYDEDRKVNVEALDPYKKEDLVIEGTEKMKNELARQRQIMRNACVIMNEATEIGSTPFKSQPESEHDNSGDKDYPFTKEGKPEEDRGAIKFDGGDPEKHSSTFGPDSNDVEDYDLDKGKAPKVAGSVASESPKGGKVARVDEAYEGTGFEKDFNGGTARVLNVVNDKHPEGVDVKTPDGKRVFIPAEAIKIWGEDQIAVSQEDYERYINGEGDDEGKEIAGEVDECGNGLWNEEGGEDAEGDEDLGLSGEDEPVDTDELNPVKPEELGDDETAEEDSVEDGDLEGGDLDDDEFDFDDEDEDLGDEDDLDDEDLGDDEESLGDEDLDDDEFGFDDEDEDFDNEDFGDDEEDDFSDDDEDFGNEEEFDDEDELDDEEDEDPEIELDENVVKKFRQLVRESINELDFSDWMPNMDPFKGGATPGGYDDDEDEEDDFDDEGYDDGGAFNKEKVNSNLYTNEAKTAKMNSIVESVVKDILKEDELHVFGDHPGYRKKPMTLPQTGEDKFQDNRDWNDDSVHSEEPFGKGKGDSTPFDQLVAQITDSVMKQINENKKKVK